VVRPDGIEVRQLYEVAASPECDRSGLNQQRDSLSISSQSHGGRRGPPVYTEKLPAV